MAIVPLLYLVTRLWPLIVNKAWFYRGTVFDFSATYLNIVRSFMNIYLNEQKNGKYLDMECRGIDASDPALPGLSTDRLWK